jgi:hypothetical protein
VSLSKEQVEHKKHLKASKKAPPYFLLKSAPLPLYKTFMVKKEAKKMQESIIFASWDEIINN